MGPPSPGAKVRVPLHPEGLVISHYHRVPSYVLPKLNSAITVLKEQEEHQGQDQSRCWRQVGRKAEALCLLGLQTQIKQVDIEAVHYPTVAYVHKEKEM